MTGWEIRESLDTAELVARFKGGDNEAFGVLYARHFEHVFRYLRLMLRNTHEAEDAAQQVFTNAFESLPGLELRRPLEAWLLTVARNLAIDLLRQSGRVDLEAPEKIDARRELAGSEPEPEVPDSLGWITDPDLVIFVERLPLPQRQVIVMRHMLDMSVQEIATQLGRTPNGVSVLHGRACEFLRDRLTAIGRAPERSERAESMRTYAPQAPVLRARRFALYDR